MRTLITKLTKKIEEFLNYRNENNLKNGVRFNNREVQQMIAAMMDWNLSEYNYRADGFRTDDGKTMIFNLKSARKFTKNNKTMANI